jgi:excisionase family DNA binding protein
MTSTSDAVMPTAEDAAVARRLAAALDDETGTAPGLALVQGEAATEVPASLREILRRVTELMAAGRGVVVVPLDRELTTREAADLLGISRPTLIKLLDAGEIGYSRPNSSRRIPLDEVLAYKEHRSRRRRSLLAELTADAVEQGTYDASSEDRAEGATMRPILPRT